MAHSLCMLDTWGYKHTLRICNNQCFFTAILVARTRLNVTLYVHCVFCVYYRLGCKGRDKEKDRNMRGRRNKNRGRRGRARKIEIIERVIVWREKEQEEREGTKGKARYQ